MAVAGVITLKSLGLKGTHGIELAGIWCHPRAGLDDNDDLADA